eukprot:Ihof_evm1s882 gene=Ihof_evmTU1s882
MSSTPRRQPHVQHELPSFRRVSDNLNSHYRAWRRDSVGSVFSHNESFPLLSKMEVSEEELRVGTDGIFNDSFVSPPTAFETPLLLDNSNREDSSSLGYSPPVMRKARPIIQPKRVQSAQDFSLSRRTNEMDMSVMEGTLLSNIVMGVKLYTRAWLPEGPAKGILFISHGFGEHCGRYNQVARQLNRAGIVVFSHDHQGHGHSEGCRGDITDYNIYVSDVLQHVEMMSNTYHGLPVFIWGHAMGACIVVSIVRKHPDLFRGFIVTAPMIMPDPVASTPFKLMLAKNIGMLNPKFNCGTIAPKYLTSDPIGVKDWENDPLNYHGPIRINWANIMTQAVVDNFKKLAQVITPFIAFQGTFDDVVLPEGAMRLYKEAKVQDKTLRMLEGLMHDLHNEIPVKRK